MAARKKTAAKTTRKTTKKAPVAKRKGATAKKVTKHAVSRATSKKASTKKASMGSVSVGRKPFTKSQFIAAICDHTGVSRKEVTAMLESISHIINAHVQKSGPEIFSWPGMFKIQVIKKPATKARQGINPFTGETMLFKAKPASRRIKIRALKQLKSMAA